MRKRLTPHEQAMWLGQVALAAARAGDEQDALRLWSERSNLDRQMKAGIEAMIRNAADENGPHNVRFNAIRPGFVATELMEGIPRDGEVYESYVRNTPLGDVAQPRDIGQLARFLIGPESRWITGQCINVDGGHSLRRGPDFTSFKG